MFSVHRFPLPPFPFLCPFSSVGLMSITVALVAASLLSLRRASERTIKNDRGASSAVAIHGRRDADAGQPRGLVGVGDAGVRFTSARRRSITLGDLLAEAKDVPNGCTVACILFVHFVHTVKASRKAPWAPGGLGQGDPVNPTSVHGVVALSFCTLERRRSGD